MICKCNYKVAIKIEARSHCNETINQLNLRTVATNNVSVVYLKERCAEEEDEEEEERASTKLYQESTTLTLHTLEYISLARETTVVVVTLSSGYIRRYGYNSQPVYVLTSPVHCRCCRETRGVFADENDLLVPNDSSPSTLQTAL